MIALGGILHIKILMNYFYREPKSINNLATLPSLLVLHFR